jgi:hypothetical protein
VPGYAKHSSLCGTLQFGDDNRLKISVVGDQRH